MNFKRNILRIPAYLFLIITIGYTIVNYSILSAAEGWGIIAMLVNFVFGLSALAVDFIISIITKSTKTQFIFRLVALLAYLLLIYLGY